MDGERDTERARERERVRDDNFCEARRIQRGDERRAVSLSSENKGEQQP